MKVFTACLGSETNTFSPILCGRDAFEGNFHAAPGRHPDYPTLYSGPMMALRRRKKEGGNWDIVEGLSTFATTGGIVTRAVYEEYRDAILGQLKAAMPVDFVALGLHGAMVADGYEDCEGDLLRRVREIVGPKVKVGAELDLHCNLTPAMVEFADVLVPYKESPHIDVMERGEELVQILADAAFGKTKPVMSVFDCRMVTSSPTTREPMKSFVARMKALEGKDGVLSVSLVHCFGFNDVPEMGYKVLVVTDDHKAEGDALAKRLGHEIYRMRREIGMTFLTIDEAIDRALAAPKGPVVLADGADNAGGGAASDSTWFIRALQRRGIRDACIGPLWDPIAVRMCFAAGEGGVFQLRFGAKMNANSGEPIDAQIKVTRLLRDAWQTFGEVRDTIGDAAAIEVDGIAVVMNSARDQAFGVDLFTNLGIDPRTKKIVVVKSHNHFFAAYSKIATEVHRTSAPGPLPLDYSKVSYKRLRRPIWPLDPDPLGLD
jgi:microcystin degradation protein MlrC